MDLERLAIRLRPRSDWEAVDLGFAMVRNWWKPVYAAWLAIAAPVATILILLLGGWGFLAFWWLLPLFESTVLTLLSRTVFGDSPPLRQILRQAPAEWLRFLPEASWRRLDTRRSFHLPVSSLERSKGAERAARIQVLTRGTSDATSWLSLSFFLFAVGLASAFISLLIVLTPPWLGIDWQLIDQQMDSGQAPWAWKGLFFVWAVMILLVDPIYVAAGFCLYLNRRTELEGWDLEIAFRNMARRVRSIKAPVRHSVAKLLPWLIVGLVVGLLGSGPEITAQPQDGEISSEKTPGEVIAEVMQKEELVTEVEEERWQLRSDLDWLDFGADEKNDEPSWSFSGGFFSGLMGIAAKLFEILLWAGLALLILLMVREMWRGAPKLSQPKARVIAAPERIAGLDVRRESLPPNIAAAAAELWRSGQQLDALSLLYRGALSRLHGEGLELRESFTEADCLVAARRFLTTERSRFFTHLTSAWQMAAYAHRLPEDATGRELIEGWSRSFETAASPVESTP